MLYIERAVPADYPVIADIDLEVMESDRLDPHEMGSGGWWWVVKDGGHIVGYAGIEYAGYGEVGFFSRVGLLPVARGQGLHRDFLRVCGAEARRLGWTQMITYVHRLNAPSLNNFIKCGYKTYIPDEDWGCDGAVYLYRDL